MANQIDTSFAIQDRGALTDAQKLNVLQDNRQLDEQRQQRLWEKQQQNQWRNQGIIGDDLNFSKYKTGEQAIDGYAQSELNKIQKEALVNHINDDPAQLEYWLTQQLVPLSQWHNQAQGSYQKLNQTLQDYNKTYPNIDLGKARDLALNKFQNDFLQVDDNGNVLRKNTDEIQPTDYNSFLQSPEVLGQVNNDQSAFGKFFSEIPKNTVGGKDYTNKQGHVQEYGWSGMMPQYGGKLVTDENNRPTSIELESEEMPAIKDANGKPLKGITDDMYNRMISNPQVRASVLGMWQNSPERQRAEQVYQQTTGQPLPQDAEKILLKNYLYNQGKQYVNHDLKTEQKMASPKITINAGSASNQQAQMTGNWAKSVVNAASKDDNATVNNLVDQMYSGNGERKLMGTYTTNENGQPMLHIRTQKRNPSSNHKKDIDEQIIDIPANSPNAEALLLGQYQNIMGSNTKAEALPFKNNPVVPTAKPQTKKSDNRVKVDY